MHFKTKLFAAIFLLLLGFTLEPTSAIAGTLIGPSYPSSLKIDVVSAATQAGPEEKTILDVAKNIGELGHHTCEVLGARCPLCGALIRTPADKAAPRQEMQDIPRGHP